MDLKDELVSMMKKYRRDWQNGLADFRNNYLDHVGPGSKQEDFTQFYSLEAAEQMFHNVWVAIEEIVILLLAAKLLAGVGIYEIPEAARTSYIPLRFRLHFNVPPTP